MKKNSAYFRLNFEKYFSACFRINFEKNIFRLVSAWILKNIFRLVSYWKIPCFLSRIFYINHHFSEIFFRLVSALIFFKNGLFVKIKNFHRKKIFFQTDSKYQIKGQIKNSAFFYSSFNASYAEDTSPQFEKFSKKVDFCDFFS